MLVSYEVVLLEKMFSVEICEHVDKCLESLRFTLKFSEVPKCFELFENEHVL